MWMTEMNYRTTIMFTKILVCIAGSGHLEHDVANYQFSWCDVFALPASEGRCVCQTGGKVVTLLEVSLPEHPIV